MRTPHAHDSNDRPIGPAPPAALTYRYDILNTVGSGGMGIVYKARDRETGVIVALKVLQPSLAGGADMLDRFKTELVLARRITHKNICRVYDLNRFDDVVAISMEYIEGESLRTLLDRVDGLSIRHGLKIVHQIIGGLSEAHAQGVTHRDLKPENILIAGDGTVKVMDFGIAKSIDTGTTMTGSISGTPAYMSPEQAQGKTADARSDIYALGMVMYEMFCGRRAFTAESAVALLLKQIQETPDAPHDLDAHFPRFLDRIILKCLAKSPAERFQSVQELDQALSEEAPPVTDSAQAPLPAARQAPSAEDIVKSFPGGRLFVPALWTRREWIGALSAAGVSTVSGSSLWIWLTRPYVPLPGAVDWYQKGFDAMQSMTYDAARKALEQAVAADPNFALAHATLARSYEELDYSDRARAAMLRAVTLAQEWRVPNSEETRLRALQFLVSRDYDRAAPLFQRLEEGAEGPAKAAAALESGWLAQLREDTEGALAAYERALVLNPNYAAAKLRLGFILGRQGGKDDLALQAFTEAESLYNASSDYEGVTETLLQRANLLNRRTRPVEAVPVIEKGLTIARTLGNRYQEIRLQLLHSVATRNLGQTTRAGDLAQQAINRAEVENMDNLAANGLLDLGNAYLVGGDIKSAEPAYRRALEIAQRGKVRRSEARAKFSLGSVFEQDHRPEEAKPLLEDALTFYRDGGYRRELIQVRTVLAGIYRQLGEYSEGVRIARETIGDVTQLQDARSEALIRERLGGNLRGTGSWPEALDEYRRAAGLLGSAVQASKARLSAAQLYWWLGQEREALMLIDEVQRGLGQNNNLQIQATLEARQTEIAYDRGNLSQAIALMRTSLSTQDRDEEADQDLSLLQALISIRSSQKQQGQTLATKVVQELDRLKSVGTAAAARMAIADAWITVNEPSAALPLLREALIFFSLRNVFESVWRAHALTAKASANARDVESNREAAVQALARLKASWPPEFVESYLARPSIRQLSADLLR